MLSKWSLVFVVYPSPIRDLAPLYKAQLGTLHSGVHGCKIGKRSEAMEFPILHL